MGNLDALYDDDEPDLERFEEEHPGLHHALMRTAGVLRDPHEETRLDDVELRELAELTPDEFTALNAIKLLLITDRLGEANRVIAVQRAIRDIRNQ